MVGPQTKPVSQVRTLWELLLLSLQTVQRVAAAQLEEPVVAAVEEAAQSLQRQMRQVPTDLRVEMVELPTQMVQLLQRLSLLQQDPVVPAEAAEAAEEG